MKKKWMSLLSCVFAATNCGLLLAQDDELPAGTAPAVAEESPAASPAPVRSEIEPLDHSALAFRKIVSGGSFDDASRSTTVRIVRDRRIVKTNRVGPGGVAQISQVAPGLYTVLANGTEGFAVFGAYLGEDAGIGTSPVGLIQNRDSRTVRDFIQTHLNRGASSPTPTGADSGEVTTYNGDFELAADGSVNGQVLRPEAANIPPTPLANLSVAFVQNGVVVSESTTDAEGRFTATGLQSGIYAFAVSGESGFAAYSTGVVQPESHVQARVRRVELVSFLKATTAGAAAAPPSDFPAFARSMSGSPGNSPVANAAGAPGTGGFGGGAGGGAGAGGGFGGGGLLGALAGGAVGAAVAEAIDDDKKKPASPAMP